MRTSEMFEISKSDGSDGGSSGGGGGNEMDREKVWEAINEKQEEWLLPLKEDLADWLNNTLGDMQITADNLIDRLDNGVIVCRLAKLIHDRADTNEQQPLAAFKLKCWENAQSSSFFARDNAANFLRWCRTIGINEAVLFESESLVLHTQPRQVVLCLLELGRVAAKCGINPPGLVKLEQEIEESVAAEAEDGSSCETSKSFDADTLEEDDHKGDQSSGSRPSTSHSMASSQEDTSNTSTTASLHAKVLQIANARCTRSHIRRISDGKYLIAGKIVFVRLLNDKHVMVRVGGGWETLGLFCARHDPGQEPLSCSDLASNIHDDKPGPPPISRSSTLRRRKSVTTSSSTSSSGRPTTALSIS